jgi:hypothetical protein
VGRKVEEVDDVGDGVDIHVAAVVSSTDISFLPPSLIPESPCPSIPSIPSIPPL